MTSLKNKAKKFAELSSHPIKEQVDLGTNAQLGSAVTLVELILTCRQRGKQGKTVISLEYHGTALVASRCSCKTYQKVGTCRHVWMPGAPRLQPRLITSGRASAYLVSDHSVVRSDEC